MQYKCPKCGARVVAWAEDGEGYLADAEVRVRCGCGWDMEEVS